MSLATALNIEPGERTLPMATTDAEEVIKSQLTENTGRHFLDSGGAHGRHWEENQENPPWEKPQFEVYDSFAVKNIYYHMTENLQRDRTAVALEMGLYALGYSDRFDRESWLSTMEIFAESLDELTFTDWKGEYQLPETVADELAGLRSLGTDNPFVFNTYNSEFGSISQHIQCVGFGNGPYPDYWMVSVHGGCDIRGGYTAPRVYKAEYGHPMTHEFSYYCENCGWSNAESCVAYGDDTELIHLPGPVDGFDLEEAGVPEEMVDYLLEQHDPDYSEGMVLHDCQHDDEYGIVRL